MNFICFSLYFWATRSIVQPDFLFLSEVLHQVQVWFPKQVSETSGSESLISSWMSLTSKGSDLISWKLRDKIMIELKFFKNSQINVENLGRNHVHLTARHGIVFGRKILETKQIFSLSNSLPKDFRQRNRSLWLFPSDDCASKYVFVNSFLQARDPIYLVRTLEF